MDWVSSMLIVCSGQVRLQRTEAIANCDLTCIVAEYSIVTSSGSVGIRIMI